MRREPIPDAVLRACACWREGPATDLITGEVLTDPEILQHLLSMVRADAGDLARELLAMRGAARRMLTKARSVYDRLCRESGQSSAQDGECWAEAEALDDLLPKEPA